MAPANRRMTSQRRVILDTLKSTHGHPTAHDIYEQVRKRLPEISLATVYRNLDLLCESGMVERIDIGPGQMRFDGDTNVHYHVRCMECGCVGDVEVDSIEGLEEAARGNSDFRIVGHRVEFVGVCPTCAAGGTRCPDGRFQGHGPHDDKGSGQAC